MEATTAPVLALGLCVQPIRQRRQFRAGRAPKALFDPHIAGNEVSGFAVASDGRFLIPVVAGQSGGPITVVVNWTAGLNK
jgi:hypothetical protein